MHTFSFLNRTIVAGVIDTSARTTPIATDVHIDNRVNSQLHADRKQVDVPNKLAIHVTVTRPINNLLF